MLIITGSLAYDYIMDFPGLFSDHILPEKIHNINLSFIVQNFAKRRGGTAGNASYALGLLHIPHIMFSCAGKDFDEYKKTFEQLGINTSSVKIYKDEYTATGLAITDHKDNQIWAYSYGAAENNEKLKLQKVAKKDDLVLIGPQGAKGSMNFVKQCIDLGIPYMFDPGFIMTQATDEELTLGVTHATYVIGNDYEINVLNTRVKNFTQLVKDKIVITTLGEEGAIIDDKGSKISIKSAKPKKVLDPSGAGDAWRGGFLAGLEKNFDLEIAGGMGAVAASYAVEKYGTQEYSFTIGEFTRRYEKTYNKKIIL
jgi:adenosine kinase